MIFLQNKVNQNTKIETINQNNKNIKILHPNNQALKSNNSQKNANYSSTTKKNNFPKVNIFTLPNKLRVFIVEDNKSKTIEYYFKLKDNVIVNENNYDLREISTLFLGESLFFKKSEALLLAGTKTKVHPKGLNGRCLTGLNDHYLDVFVDFFTNPFFNESEFDNVKTYYLNQFLKNYNNFEYLVQKMKIKWNNLGRVFIDYPSNKNILNFKVRHCRDFFNKFFTPENIDLIVIGNISTESMKIILDEKFEKWTSLVAPPVISNKKIPQNGIIVNYQDDSKTFMFIKNCINLPKSNDTDFFKIKILSELMEKSFKYRESSLVFKNKNVIYSEVNNSTKNILKNTEIYFKSLYTENIVEDYNACLNNIRDYKKQFNVLINEDLLNEIKQDLISKFKLNIQDNNILAEFIVDLNEFNPNTNDYCNYWIEKISNITVNDMKKFVNKYLSEKNTEFIFIGNKKQIISKVSKLSLNYLLYDLHLSSDKYD